MNSYFSSVFTVEDHENFPDLEYITNKKLCIIFCSATEVEKLLRNLNIYESPGSDCTSPRILRECAQVLSSPLTLFLNTSFSQGQPPSLQFTRKGAKILWRTTAKYHYRMQQKLQNL